MPISNPNYMSNIATAVELFLRRHNHKKLQPKAALIDMDGVLYDSMKNHVEAWFRTMSAIGIECDKNEFYLYEGRTGASTINILFNRCRGRNATEQEIKELYAEKTRQFALLPNIVPMPGAADMIAGLQNAGIRPVLVTGSGQGSLLNRLAHDYPGVFTPEYMVTAYDVKFGKPHPEPYLMGLQKANAKAHEAFVIENAPLGVEAGVAAQIFTVAVNTGPMPDCALSDAGANLIYRSMPDFAAGISGFCSTLKNACIE